MNKQELRAECARLFLCREIKDCIDILNIYSEFFFMVVKNHHNDNVENKADSEAKIVLQMMHTKALSLEKMVKGISFTSKNGDKLNNIIDPTIVASLVRNIYETTGAFNLIYRFPKTKDEKEILYNLWVHAGLSYRQKFKDSDTSDENEEKFRTEQTQMDAIVKSIEQNNLYSALDEKNQEKLKTKIKKRDYLLYFDNCKVNFLHWHELHKIMGVKDGEFDSMYTYYSLYAHPSNVSVFQFADMFNKNQKIFEQLTKFNLRYAFYLFSIFIADYIKLFPPVINTFEKLEILDQIVIDFYNKISRGEEYSINNSWKECE